MWLCIKNENEFPIEALSLGGFTTKRGDSSTIGEFGTGRIYAFILSLKLNIQVVLQTKEAIVRPTIEKIVVAGRELEKLAFEVRRGKKKEIVQTSFTLDMGKNWESAFQMFREFYANAYDEMHKKPEITFEKSILRPSEVAEQTTLLYIKFNRDIKEIYNNIDYYFPIDHPGIYDGRYGVTILSYQGKERGGIYVKGVLVKEIQDSIFSYRIDDLKLNEERNIASIWSMEHDIQYCLLYCDDPFIVTKLLENLTKKTLENKLLTQGERLSDKARETWKTAFRLLNGDNACIQTDRMSSAVVASNKYKPIKYESSIADFAQQFAPSDTSIELVISKNRKVLHSMGDTLDLQVALNEAKIALRETGYFMESTLSTKVEFDENTIDPVGIEQGIIVINPKYVYSELELKRFYLRAIIAISNDISPLATTEKIEELLIDFIERVSERNTRASIAETLFEQKYTLNYDTEKRRLSIPTSLVVTESQEVEIVVSGKSVEFRTSGSDEEKMFKTTLENPVQKPFILKAKLGYGNSSFYIQIPKRLNEVVDNFGDLTFVSA